jgi:hypothetical protein
MYNNIPEGSKQTQKILSIFTNKNKNAAKGKENKSSNLPGKNILFDDPNLIEESRKEFAAEYLAKYGDADIERRAIPISNYPSPDSVSINQMDFNRDVYTPEYNCDTFIDIFKNYNKDKNDVDKIKLKMLLNDLDCREIDTIGINKNDPINWNIPDGQFRSLLNELEISEPYNANIQDIIQTRKKAKTLPYIIKKLTAGKSKRNPKRTRRSTRKKQRNQRKQGKQGKQRKSRKNKV